MFTTKFERLHSITFQVKVEGVYFYRCWGKLNSSVLVDLWPTFLENVSEVFKMNTKYLVLLTILLSHFNVNNGQQILQRNRFRRLNKPSGNKFKHRLQEKLNQYKQRTIQTICYGKFLNWLIFCCNWQNCAKQVWNFTTFSTNRYIVLKRSVFQSVTTEISHVASNFIIKFPIVFFSVIRPELVPEAIKPEFY